MITSVKPYSSQTELDQSNCLKKANVWIYYAR